MDVGSEEIGIGGWLMCLVSFSHKYVVKVLEMVMVVFKAIGPESFGARYVVWEVVVNCDWLMCAYGPVIGWLIEIPIPKII